MIVSIAREGQEIGQYPEESVAQLLVSGEVRPTDHYWHEGMDQWALVSERWPTAPTMPRPSHPGAPALKVPPISTKPSHSKRWIVIAALAAVLIGLAAYFYLSRQSAPEPVPPPSVAAATSPETKPPATSSEEKATPATSIDQQKITVISWNLEWYPGRGSKSSAEERESHKAAAKAVLRKLNPDIFLGQEIATWEDFMDLCSVVPGLDVAVVSHYLQGKNVARQQTTIASKLPIVSAWYDNWKPAKDQPPRGYATAVVKIPESDQYLLVYSLHLKSNLARNEEETRENYAQREESTRQLLAHIEELEKGPFKGRIAGIIVGGDLNTNHDGQFGDTTVQILTDAGFTNTWERVAREDRYTWRGNDDYEPTTFDYILTKGLGSPQAVLVEVPAEASDHWPLKLEIALP